MTDGDNADRAEHLAALMNACRALRTDQQFDQAIADFTRVIDWDDERSGLRAEALFNRSSLLKQKGRLQESLADARECLDLATDPAVGFPSSGDTGSDDAIVDALRKRIEDLS